MNLSLINEFELAALLKQALAGENHDLLQQIHHEIDRRIRFDLFDDQAVYHTLVATRSHS